MSLSSSNAVESTSSPARDDGPSGTVSPAEQIRKATEAARRALLQHPIYAAVHSIDRLRLLMREHAFAVWDFMSLLKRLQREVAGTDLPWTPPRHPAAARMINEIVLGEESDEDSAGGFASHLDLYLASMDELNADSRPLRSLLDVTALDQLPSALETVPILDSTRAFVRFNLDLALNGPSYGVAAAFCFGREDIIPDMFTRLVTTLEQQHISADRLKYYLARHIELDGDTHGPLAMQLVDALIGDDEHRLATACEVAEQAITHRIALWDGVYESLQQLPA